MRRFNADEVADTLGWADGAVDPHDWGEAVRMHEAAHVTLAEAYGIPVLKVQAQPDMYGGDSSYTTAPADVCRQAEVSLIGAPAGTEELRQRGYDDEDLLHNMDLISGNVDRAKVWDYIERGLPVDGHQAQQKAYEVLARPDFQDAAHNVAQALKDQGDRLTRQDIVAAMGSYRENNGLLTPEAREMVLPPSARREREETERHARDDRYRSYNPAPEPGLERDL